MEHKWFAIMVVGTCFSIFFGIGVIALGEGIGKSGQSSKECIDATIKVQDKVIKLQEEILKLKK
jgi:hypothetical protein